MSEEDDKSKGDEGEKDKNLKAEMDRKFDNIQKQNQEIADQSKQTNQQIQSVLDSLSAMNQKPKPAPSVSELADLEYTDPDRYAEIKANEREDKFEKRMMDNLDKREERGQTMGRLVADFPELSDTNSKLTKRAIEIHNTLGNELKETGAGYELAVTRAAREIGTVEMSRRGEKDDGTGSEDLGEFMSDADRGERDKNKDKSSELHSKTEAFLLEIEKRTNKKINRDNVKNHVKNRKGTWGKWR